MTSLFARQIGRMVALVCLCIAVTSRSGAAQETDVLVAAHFPPIMIEGSAAQPGYAVEIFQAAAERLDRRVEVVFVPFQRALHRLETEPGTVFPSLFRTPSRQDKFLWIVQLNAVQLTFVTANAPLPALDDARGLGSVAVAAGGTPDGLLTALGFDNIVRVQSPDAAKAMLKAGRIDAWFTSGAVAASLVSQSDDDMQIGPSVAELPSFVAANIAYPKEQAQAYRDVYAQMQTDGTIARIALKYGVDLK